MSTRSDTPRSRILIEMTGFNTFFSSFRRLSCLFPRMNDTNQKWIPPICFRALASHLIDLLTDLPKCSSIRLQSFVLAQHRFVKAVHLPLFLQLSLSSRVGLVTFTIGIQCDEKTSFVTDPWPDVRLSCSTWWLRLRLSIYKRKEEGAA